jgi:hypothetical protein
MQVRVPIYSMSLAAVAALALLTIASPSWATDSCWRDAKQTKKDCVAGCTEDLQASKDACLNRDHTCVEVCRAERYDCRQATGFDGLIEACNNTLDGAKQQCRTDHPAGSPERDACIDQMQVIAFQCRDSVREAKKPLLKQCRKTFLRTCAPACPPAGPSGPADVNQCRMDARDARKTCQAGCVEDSQVAKDVCRHRDHTCVEQCRADREGCRQPVQTQLDSDIALCNATRGSHNPESGAIGNCDAQYGPSGSQPDPALLDQCIDNAQVAAFECRDTANENAQHPGFETCRENFQSCAEGCPAA